LAVASTDHEVLPMTSVLASGAVRPRAGATPAEELERQLEFERALVEISARVASAAPEALEAEIARGLTALLAFLDVDRSTFFEFLAGDEAFVLCSVAVPGVQAIPRGPFRIPMRWYLGELRAGRAVVMPRLPEGLPREAADEASHARDIGMRANLSVPLRLGAEVRFAIAAGAFRESRGWSDTVIARLKLVGEVFAQAVARARTEERLRKALTEVSALKEKLEAENDYLRHAAPLPPEADALPSHAPAFRRALEEATQVAPTRSTVLLLGETGTGKELLASYIHGASPRRERPMIKLNCAALPASLIEAELFGREKGAYTGALTRQIGRFELAHGSTIFLDEVGELPLELQPKLLRVLQEGEFERVGGTQTIKVDVRVIAATNRSLAEEARAGRFRQDLYYRLNVFPIQLPPLRERAADVPMLVWQFAREFAHSVGKVVERIPEDTMAALQAYPWPGNVRELRNVVERAMILCRDGVLRVSLPEVAETASHAPAPAATPTQGTLAERERREIESVLARCGWRIRGTGGAAERLGLKPTTLESRMKKLGIERPR
jgi:transcriptional regulator with GAF, ATPase, and Fis domain